PPCAATPRSTRCPPSRSTPRACSPIPRCSTPTCSTGRTHERGRDLRPDQELRRRPGPRRPRAHGRARAGRRVPRAERGRAADVELFLLDEPTSGLDPLMEAVFTECIAEAKAAGRSVLLSSHILAEVEKLCDTVTIIRNGRTVESGTLTELRHLTRNTVTAV